MRFFIREKSRLPVRGSSRFTALILLSVCFGVCGVVLGDNLKLHDKVPNKVEHDAVGLMTSPIKRDSDDFKKLTKNDNPDVVFKDPDNHLMTAALSAKVDALAELVKKEWPGKKLRISEAWADPAGADNDPHMKSSMHREARAVDISVSDKDGAKLGRLARLAVDAGFGWVFYEDELHVHASVAK